MKSIDFLLIGFLFLATTQTITNQAHPHNRHLHLQDAQILQAHIIKNLHHQLQTLNPNFLDNFSRFFHSIDNQEVSEELASAQNGTYFLLLGKMYLYRLLDNPKQLQLKRYVTSAHLLAAYFYLKIAAESHGNDQAYFLLGLLQQFKLVPDKLIETNLAEKIRNKDQEILFRHLKFSHLNNAEHMLYISAALGFDPAALVLGHMNRQPFGTPQNCTAALAYYLAVLKRNLFNIYVPKLVFEVKDSLEDELFARRRLESEQERKGHEFVVETGYFDEQTISATLQQANRYYTGSGGVMRDLAHSLKLYVKLAQQGNTDGKIMAGLMYFRGEGTVRDVKIAKHYFDQSSKDEVSEYMLLAMQYFEIIQPKTREKAILTMKNKIAKRSKLSHLMQFLIGSAALKGEIKEITQDQAIQMIDRSAAEGNPSARLLMAILFADGTKGLKYGCTESTKYLSDDALSHPYFRQRVNTAQVAIKKGEYSFAFFKYFQLIFNNYPTAFVNTLYLIEMYPRQTLRITQQSWLPSVFSKTPAYISLRKLKLVPDVTSFLLNQYSPVGLKPIKINELDELMFAGKKYVSIMKKYMMNKIVKRGVIQQKRGILKYYEYKLLIEQGGDFQSLQTILSTLASGDSTKMYVSQARYLLGKLYHTRALRNKTVMTTQQSLKVMGEYNRAVKSQLLGNLIFEIEQYRLTGLFSLNFSESDLGEDLLSYVFVLSISLFTLYYLRSKRFDHFHKIELEKQVRKAQEQFHQQQIKEGQNKQPEPLHPTEVQIDKKNQVDPDQPVIIEDPAPENQYLGGGVRIGSSADDDLN